MLNEQFVTMEIGKAKNIALVAHDGKKQELVEWCDRNKDILKGHFLCGTGTTAKLIAENRTSGQRLLQRPAGRRPADRCEDRGRQD